MSKVTWSDREGGAVLERPYHGSPSCVGMGGVS